METHSANGAAESLKPSCLYLQERNAYQTEIAIKSHLSSLNKEDIKEPELNPTALNNVDPFDFTFIPLLNKSPIGTTNANQKESESVTLEKSSLPTCARQEHIISTPLPSSRKLKSFIKHDISQLTPINSYRQVNCEQSPVDGAMISANSSGYFGISDLEDSISFCSRIPGINNTVTSDLRLKKEISTVEVDTKPTDCDNKNTLNNSEKHDHDISDARGATHTSGPPSVISSVDGKDAEPHSPVSSPHSSTSGNISDLSDTSLNILDTSLTGEHVQRGLIKEVCTASQLQCQVQVSNNTTRENDFGETIKSNKDFPKSGHRSNSTDYLSQDSDASAITSSSRNKQTLLNSKPADSYVSLIAKAILSNDSKKLMLHEIYENIMNTYNYYRNNQSDGWRNAIRHNLSVSECFIKVGKAETGRGYFWTIHPACLQQFTEGDFQRKEARKRVKEMEDQKTAKVAFANQPGFHLPEYRDFPTNPYLGYYPHHSTAYTNTNLPAFNRQNELPVNLVTHHQFTSRVPLINQLNTGVAPTTRARHRYQPYFQPQKPDRRLRDLEQAPPNVAVNSLGLFVRKGINRK